MSRDSFAFEAAVRQAAEAIWGLAPGDCQPAWYVADPMLHELDGLAELRDMTHVVMATQNTKLDKVRSDVLKLDAAAKYETRRRGLPTEKWLITELQLAAEHVKYAREHGVKLMTLEQFRNRFFDAEEYVQKRRRAPFGSARNLVDGSITVPEDEYVDLPLIEMNWTRDGWHGLGSVSLDGVANEIAGGEWFVLVGPFGAGKSLTTRELFFKLVDRLNKTRRESPVPVPVPVNLREHWGALFGDEILSRHARAIGLANKDDLTVAWRSGIACLLLDGFDEVASQAIARPTDRNWTRQIRNEALSGVRDLVTQLPSGSGLLMCGRDHYFDDPDEMRQALGLVGRRYRILRVEEFDEVQAMRFLARHGSDSPLPDWLPRKPLILGYLAHHDLLADVLKIDGSQGFGFVWDQFLDLICEREAQHQRSGMDPRTVRRVLERLASIARATSSGVGPITGLDIAEAYRGETGDAAGEAVLMQLQRLPGLTQREQDPTARSFVDQDLLEALAGSAVARAIVEADKSIAERRWLAGIGRRGASVASHILQTQGYTAETVVAAAARFSEARADGSGQHQLAADCLAVAVAMARDKGDLDCRGLTLDEVAFGELDLEGLRVLDLLIRESMIDLLAVDRAIQESTVRIAASTIGRVTGVPSLSGLPDGVAVQCAIEAFDDASTNAALLRLNLPASIKALLTVLRKLYVQAGAGRKLGALTRGLPDGKVCEAVPRVLQALEAEGLVYVTGEIAHPVRRQTARVQRILAAGGLSDDPLVARLTDDESH